MDKIKCPECGELNRPGSGRCIHCGALYEKQSNKGSEFSQMMHDLDEIKGGPREKKIPQVKPDEKLRVLPEDQDGDVELMPDSPVDWRKILTNGTLIILVLVLGFLAFRMLTAKPPQTVELNNFVDRPGEVLYMNVLGVKVRADYQRAQDTLIDNPELFDQMEQNNTIKLIPNGTRGLLLRDGIPFSEVEVGGEKWLVLTDYIKPVSGDGGIETGTIEDGDSGPFDI